MRWRTELIRSRMAASSPGQRCAKLRRVEHQPHRRRAMIGRHRPHFARALENVRHRRRGRLGLAGLDEQRADAVAIDAEILVAALRGDHLVAGVDRTRAGPRASSSSPRAEALIGDVDERQQAALGDDPRHFRPLIVVQVGAGRDCGSSRAAARRRPLALPSERRNHRVEADRAGVAVVIRIFDHLQPDPNE